MEYCSSSFTTTLYLVSSVSSLFIESPLFVRWLDRIVQMCKIRLHLVYARREFPRQSLDIRFVNHGRVIAWYHLNVYSSLRPITPPKHRIQAIFREILASLEQGHSTGIAMQHVV